MYHHNPNPQFNDNFVIQIRSSSTDQDSTTTAKSPKLNFSSMKVFDKFRRILMRLIFSIPSSGGSSSRAAGGGNSSSAQRRKSCDHGGRAHHDPPKTSCSSYYSLNTDHYNEAIADCIEFFNKSSHQEENIFGGRKSDVWCDI